MWFQRLENIKRCCLEKQFVDCACVMFIFFVKSYSIKNKVKEVAGDCQLATKVTDK